MRKLLNKPWFVALLAFSAVGFVAYSLKSQLGGYGGSGSSEEPIADIDQNSDAADGSPVSLSIEQTLRDLVLSGTSRDPFRPRARPEAAPVVIPEKAGPDAVDTVRLTALWSQGGVTYLLVNDHIMKTGDQIGHVTLDTVTADGVWLTHWKGRSFLNIGDTFTLTTPARQPSAQTVATPPSDS